MRNINQELKKYDPRLMSIEQGNRIRMKNIMNSRYPYVYCPDCGVKILNDNTRISRHFREVHIRDRKNKIDRGYRFHPITS